MRVVIEADVFSKAHSAEVHGGLLSLLHFGLEGHHTVEVSPEGSPAFRRWLDERDAGTQALCKKALDIAIKRRARRKRLSIQVADIPAPSWKDRRLPVGVALSLLRRPLTLLLENGRNERAFLRVVCRLRKDFELDALEKKGIIDCRTYGGIDENRKWLEASGHDPEVALRCWVMCDSDARRPWTRPAAFDVPADLGRAARKMAECCQEREIRMHILARRFIESYLPLPAIQSWAALKPVPLRERAPSRPSEREEKYQALARMTPMQRHHYNMKKGFAKDEKDPEHEGKVGDLYVALDPADRQALHEGIDEHIAKLFHEDAFQVRMQWLETDGQAREVHQIVDSIMELV